MENPEQDIKWECQDCGKVWYDDSTVLYLYCEDCKSPNLIED